MGAIDPVTGQYSDIAYGLDTHQALADQTSLFSNVSDLVTKGIPLTGAAIINSFLNTGVEAANMFGAGLDKVGISDEFDKEYTDYYNDHATGIEGAALVAGSLIPGLAAVKVLKLAQAGEMTSVLARATNIFAGPKAKLVQDSLEEIAAGNQSLYGSLTANKIKAIALGFGDQALQAATYEVATAATMKASPLLDDQSFGDVMTNMATGIVLGGGIGGALEGWATRAIFNKALLNADIGTKVNEVSTRLGQGNYFAGDHIAALWDSLDKIPQPPEGNALANTKYNANLQNAKLDSMKILQNIAPDKEVANTLLDAMVKMKQEGNLTQDDFINYFARLAKVDRITTPATTPQGDTFYFNKFAPNKTSDWNDIATNSPHPEAEVSRAFQLRDPLISPKIARASDNVTWENTTIPKFANAEAAFAEGHDVFLNSKLQAIVNPKAPNLVQVPISGQSRVLTAKEYKSIQATGKLPDGSKPLLGAPLVFNTQTGGVTTSAVATVGDHGGVKLVANGLEYGETLSPQTITTTLSKDTTTIDANARYVWAAQRGLKFGDSISGEDVPMLEEAYRNSMRFKDNEHASAWDQFQAFLKTKKIGFADSDNFTAPSSSADLLASIRDAKDNLIQETMQSHPELSAEEVALRANVKQDYIENGLQSNDPKDFLVDPNTYVTPTHVQMEYNIGNIHTQDGQIMRGMVDVAYRISLIKDVLQTNAAKFFGPNYERYIATAKSSEATIKGAGSTFLSSAQANYGTLAQQMERIGKYVASLTQEKLNAVSDTLTNHFTRMRNDPALAAEVSYFRSAMQRTGHIYEFMPPDLQATHFPGLETNERVAVLSRSLQDVKGEDGTLSKTWNEEFMPEGIISGAKAANSPGQYNYYILTKGAADFADAHSKLNDLTIAARNNLSQATGQYKQLMTGKIYMPPVDTGKYPYVAYVRQRAGTGMDDGGVHAIFANTQDGLQQKIAGLQQDFEIFTKADIKKFHEVQGDYQYDRNLSQTYVNATMARRGVLSDQLPSTNVQQLVKDFTDFHTRQQIGLIRDHVESANSQLFAELRAMGDAVKSPATSKVGVVADFLGRSESNPYISYIKTALGVSDKEQYRFWSDTQDKLESLFDTAFRTARESFGAASRGLLSYEDASQLASQFGLGNPYSAATDQLSKHLYEDVANKLPPARYLSKFLATANSVLGNTVINLDTFQQMVHVLSTPIMTMSELQSVKSLQPLVSTELPDGSGRSIPAVSKIFYNTISNYFNSSLRAQKMEFYKSMGVIRSPEMEYIHTQMMDALSLPYGSWTQSGLVQKASQAVELGKTLSGSRWSETFTSWMAANSADQIFSAMGYTGRQLEDNIITFVNRAKANIVASQRPIAFQGPLGQAIGLFQTYQFNILQNLLRYVENGEAKTVATMFGMQSTLFGAQGLPGFMAINNHIVGNLAGNSQHQDLYSTVPNFLGQKLGNYLLYGVTSNILNAGYYERGDINPRRISLLPVNPLEYPAISGGIRFAGNMLDTASKIAKGGNVTASLLLGLEHNGLSRPLAGIAQLAQGYSTTSEGSLLSATLPPGKDGSVGFNELWNAGFFSRLLGARPLDEAVTMDGMYRMNAYLAKDHARMEALGSSVKTTLYAGDHPSSDQIEQFMREYSSIGGTQGNFAAHMVSWTGAANASIANKIFNNLKSPRSQNMMQVMGGQPLADFRNSGANSVEASVFQPQSSGE